MYFRLRLFHDIMLYAYQVTKVTPNTTYRVYILSITVIDL